ncbi:MAG: S9 family peptidase [Clostridium sulfidigenes]|uniref:S9 family peptidase n=1 Tax=Clostridium sulfidigenes TaxID=318464 RepID=A0A927W6C5_9CLOT|nr:S9 family peptidase [Clostridium sulfidigenes]
MKNIQLEDFTKYNFLSSLNFSPKGDTACFVVSNCNLEDNTYDSNLWLYDLTLNKYHQLTAFNKERSYIWLQDNETILFQGVRDSKDKKKLEDGDEFTQFYKLNIRGGEAVKAFKIPMLVDTIVEVDEDTFLFTGIHKVGGKSLIGLSDAEKAEELKCRKEEKDYEVLDEIPFWSNGGGFTNKKRSGLYKYVVSTEEINLITDEYTSVMSLELSEDKSKAVFAASSYKDKAEINDELYIYNIKLDKLSLINGEEKFSYSYVNFMDEDKLIVLGSDMKEYGINEDGKFYLIDINTNIKTLLTPDFDKSTWNSVGSDCRYGGGKSIVRDSKYLYFITTEIDSSYINRINIDGNIEKISFNKGSVDCFDIKNGNILFIGLRNQKLQEIYSLKDDVECEISKFNQWIHDELKISKPERVEVETEPGVVIEGWVLKPVDFEENKKYPAILDIHGGPKTVYGEVFYHEMQLWANMGYFVFFCNPRGSDGHGRAYADIRGKYGTIDYHDIMTFTDIVLDKYKNIDVNNVGVTGGSYGGFMTNWIIGHTDRFKAAASQRSISNWISKFCTTDIGFYFVDDQNGGTPWSNVDKLWYHSPLKYADKVKTPTLFIHSEEDYRCWLAEGIQMFTALKYHGVEARLCMFRGENHELSRSGKPKHRIRRITEITNWFEEHLK